MLKTRRSFRWNLAKAETEPTILSALILEIHLYPVIMRFLRSTRWKLRVHSVLLKWFEYLPYVAFIPLPCKYSRTQEASMLRHQRP
jgi:hypothetical protein